MVILLFAFVMVERRSRTPLIPLSTFRQKVLRNANLTAMFMLGCLVTLFFFASLYMQQVLGYSPIRTGLAYLPIALIMSVGAGVSQGLVRKVARSRCSSSALSWPPSGWCCCRELPVHASYPADVLPASWSAGSGWAWPSCRFRSRRSPGSSEQISGLAAGLINTSQEAGGALGVAIAASIAFARIPALTKWAGSIPARILQARADVFPRGIPHRAGFAVLGVIVALTLPMMRASEHGVVAAG